MDISEQCKNKGKTMKNTSKEATHPVIPWDTSKSFMHYDKENSSSLKVCQVGPSHLTVIFICCQQRFVLLVAAFFMRKRSSLCMHFFDSKYCFRQRVALSRLHSHKEMKNSSCCNKNRFLMFSSAGVPEIPRNQPLQR